MHTIQKGLFYALLLLTSALHAQFSVTIQVDQNISCNGGNNGILTAVVSPAGSAYTFDWSNGGNTATITDLVADVYVVTVQNAAGGTVMVTAVLTEPAALELAPVTELPLFVNPTGNVEVETSGGTLPYAFQWADEANQPFSNEEDLLNAPAGIYTQTVTDANGCTAVLTPVELIQTSGAKDLFETGIRVFPNPASTDLTLEIPGGGPVQMQVFNAAGQLLESQTLLNPSTRYSVAHFPAGYYAFVFPGLGKTVRVCVYETF